jgi:hypothetical protein
VDEDRSESERHRGVGEAFSRRTTDHDVGGQHSRVDSIEPGEIVEASELATKALARLGAQVVTCATNVGEISTAEMRRRGFTLLELDYEPVRRYGAFLFWNLPGGWEQYVPSLRSGRTSGEAKPSEVIPPVNP